jgi:uncharacterized protein (DUF2147 family)
MSLSFFLPFVVALVAAWPQFSAAQHSPLGTWLTTDDETGEAKSHIELYAVGDRIFGKIAHLLRPSLNHNCDKCDGHRKDQPVLGMVIIEDMRLTEGHWQHGRVLYPRQGKWYSLKFWLKDGDPNTLAVRGSFGPFYRTQYWKRI